MANFGVSFLPGEGQDGTDGMDARRQQAFQQAIQLLNLRLPRVTGANAIAPSALLNAQSQPPGMNSALALQALARMAGMGGMAGRNGMGPMAPSITPSPLVGNPIGGATSGPNLPPAGMPIPPPNPAIAGPISPGGPGNLPRPMGGPISPPGPGNLPRPRVKPGIGSGSPPGPGNLPPAGMYIPPPNNKLMRTVSTAKVGSAAKRSSRGYTV